MKLNADYSTMSEKERKEYELSLKYLYTAMAFGILFYYVMPYILLGFGGEVGKTLYGYSFMSIYPVFIFVASFLHARKFGFQVIIPAALAIFFLPTSFIFYRNAGLVPFAFFFFIMGLFGELSGFLLLRRSKSKKQPLGLNKLVKMAEGENKNSDSKKSKSKGSKKGK